METTQLTVSPPQENLPEVLSGIIEGLTPAEQAALEHLAAGSSIAAAARTARVARSTLNRWLEPGRPLASALKLWKQEQTATSRNRLVMATDKATTNVLDAVDRGDARLSFNLLKQMGIIAGPPVGPTHQEAQTAKAVAEAQAAMRREEIAAKPPLKFTEQLSKFTLDSIKEDYAKRNK